jgi:hypothetical protein
MSPTPDDPDKFPTSHEVLCEIGWALVIHLAIAGAVVMVLQTLGIA